MDAAPSNQSTQPAAELPLALLVVTDLVELIGAEKVAGFSVHSGNIRIQPSDLRDGEEIADKVGLPFSLDHHTTTPETTDFYGPIRGIEVHVRGALRRATA